MAQKRYGNRDGMCAFLEDRRFSTLAGQGTHGLFIWSVQAFTNESQCPVVRHAKRRIYNITIN